MRHVAPTECLARKYPARTSLTALTRQGGGVLEGRMARTTAHSFLKIFQPAD